MNRILIFATAVMIAGVPAAIGLAGNTSFAQGVKVPVPAHATLLTDDTVHPEPSDDTPVGRPERVDQRGRQGWRDEARRARRRQRRQPQGLKSADDSTHHSSATPTRSSGHSTRSASPSDDKGGHSGGGGHGGGGGGGNDGSGHK